MALFFEKDYPLPPAGEYRFWVQNLDMFGRPLGEETSLLVRVPLLWWKRPWIWALALGSLVSGTVALTRAVTKRRLREQLAHFKEEQLIEQERLRIARDIHDTLAQGFTGVIVQLEAAEDAQSRGLMEIGTAHIARARALARDSLQEARRSVHALRPQILEQRELAEALRETLDQMSHGSGILANVSVDGVPRRLDPKIECDLLHITQEALANALRHSAASRFSVRLVFESKTVRMELQDNGRGFDPRANHDGFGLTGMRERVECMGGKFSLRSTPGTGTVIVIAFTAPTEPTASAS